MELSEDNIPEKVSYDYAIIRLIPDLERGECINLGVILYCASRRFLALNTNIDEQRISSFAPELDLLTIQRQLQHLTEISKGKQGGGPLGQLSPSERFHWLVAPRSTIIQTSSVHSGLCSDPQATLNRLFAKLVRTRSVSTS